MGLGVVILQAERLSEKGPSHCLPYWTRPVSLEQSPLEHRSLKSTPTFSIVSQNTLFQELLPVRLCPNDRSVHTGITMHCTCYILIPCHFYAIDGHCTCYILIPCHLLRHLGPGYVVIVKPLEFPSHGVETVNKLMLFRRLWYNLFWRSDTFRRKC